MITIASHDIRCHVPAADLVARWVDVETHPEWSHGLEQVTLDGPVRLGATGRLTPRGGPTVRFEVSTLVPGRAYGDTSRLPGARLTFLHEAFPDGGATQVRVRASLSGPLARVWALTAFRGEQKAVEEDTARLIALLERPAAGA